MPTTLMEMQMLSLIHIYIWEMRYLPQEVRERFHSDMRIVLDYLAEGNNLRSDQKVVHLSLIHILQGPFVINVEERKACQIILERCV